MDNQIYTTEEALKHAGINTDVPNRISQQHSHNKYEQEITTQGAAFVGSSLPTAGLNVPLSRIQTNRVESSFPHGQTQNSFSESGIPFTGTQNTFVEFTSPQATFVRNNFPAMETQAPYVINNCSLASTQGLTTQIEGTYISNEIPVETVTSGNQYINQAKYVTSTPCLNKSQSIDVDSSRIDVTNAGLLPTNYTTPGVQHTHLAGAAALETGVIGADLLDTNQHHFDGAGRTVLTADVSANLGNSNGTFMFRPIEGKFAKNKDVVGRMDAYCKFKIGWHSGKSSLAKSEGTHPTWADVISIDRKHNEEFAKLKIKDKDRISLNDKIGETKISLNEIAAKGRVQQWFNVYKKDQLTGEILLDIEFQPRTTF